MLASLQIMPFNTERCHYWIDIKVVKFRVSEWINDQWFMKSLAKVAVSEDPMGRWCVSESVSGQVCHWLLAQAQCPHSRPTKTTTVWLLLATHSWKVNQDATSSVSYPPISHTATVSELQKLKHFTNQTSSKTIYLDQI